MILTEKHQNISIIIRYKIDKYEHLTGEEKFSCDQSRIIEQAKFTFSPLSELNEIKDFFQKKRELMKLRIRYMKLKNGRKN